MAPCTRWTLAWALLPALAQATSIRPHTLEERAAASTRVSLVKVLSRRAVAAPEDPRQIKTFTELLVAEDVKGDGPQRVTLVQLGGTVGLWSVEIPGNADFRVGETALVFLNCREPARCVLVAMEEGKLPLVSASEVVVHDLFTGVRVKRPLADVTRQLRAAPPAKGGGR